MLSRCIFILFMFLLWIFLLVGPPILFCHSIIVFVTKSVSYLIKMLVRIAKFPFIIAALFDLVIGTAVCFIADCIRLLTQIFGGNEEHQQNSIHHTNPHDLGGQRYEDVVKVLAEYFYYL